MPTENTKIPFSLYDFFGYIFPGTYFGLMIILVANSSDSRLFYLIRKSTDLVYQSSSVLSNILSASLLLVIAYSLGHIIATVSHIAIDRLLVSGVLGYPIQRLLKLPPPPDQFHVKRSTSIYIFVVLLFVLMRPVVHYHAGTKLRLDSRNCPDLFSMCNPIYYEWLFGIFLVLVAFKVIHALIVSEPYYSHPGTFFRRYAPLRWSVLIYTAPARFIFIPMLHVVETLLGTERKFPPELVTSFSTAFKERFGMDSKTAGTENYWLTFFHSNAADPNATRLLFNWLHIYGFARNMGAACFLILVYILYRMHRMEEGDLLLIMVVYALNFYLMIFFVIRYWLIYSTYFSKSIVRAFYVNSRVPANSAPSE